MTSTPIPTAPMTLDEAIERGERLGVWHAEQSARHDREDNRPRAKFHASAIGTLALLLDAARSVGPVREALERLFDANDAAVTAMVECANEADAIHIAQKRGAIFSAVLESVRTVAAQAYGEKP